MKQSFVPGASYPLGSALFKGGANFSLFSRLASKVELLLFDRVDDARPSRTIQLDAGSHRTYHYWHAFVPGVTAGQIYGYRVNGPFEPDQGLRFDPTKVLLDPYGRGVLVPPMYSRQAAAQPGDNAAIAMKSVVADPRQYDWEGDEPPHQPSARTIIYEMHVRGFTHHPSSGVKEDRRGTYLGLIDKIPYLKDLGITAVELLPVFQFDAQDAPPDRLNYWGYAPISFFAPHQAYSSRQDPLGPLDEFRDMVKALHRAGIEVILDVVYNHTAEGGENGPTLCYRGLANDIYYILEADQSRCANYTGTGNTLNANNPIVRRMILDSLRYWVQEMHVDGFRFDLASILARDAKGHVLPNPPILWDIESDPLLAGRKLIAEAWDAAGLYQVGGFVGDSWKEWNGRFRDDARDFFRGAEGAARRFADRMIGSPEIYGHEDREPEQSVNFVTCHDGFTLNDLVSYDGKHNEANGEDNRDGTNDNRSWNCGVEGPSDDPAVERIRNRQVKNHLAATLLSLGVPMILAGDEMRRTQHGNNNAYCQDNETSWLDWSLLTKHADVHRFVKLLAARRLLRGTKHERLRTSLTHLIRTANKTWHGVRLNQPDWSDQSRSIALTVELREERLLLHLILNAYWEPLEFELPSVGAGKGCCWQKWIDTAQDPPNDICPWEDAPVYRESTCKADARSIVALYARQTDNPPQPPAVGFRAPFPEGYRASGILLHVTSLPSPFGIGDVGPAANAWVDQLVAAGQTWWQVLPLGPTGAGHSPYQALSSFAANPLIISPERLVEEGLVEPNDIEEANWPAGHVDFDRVIPFKRRLLARAWEAFGGSRASELGAAFEQFRGEKAALLEQPALFMALKTKFGGKSFQEWPRALARREPAALRQAKEELAPNIEQFMFEQFLILRHWKALKLYANQKGLKLLGDLPIFVAPDSSDVWANPELFLLDDDLKPKVVAGVPPDYFSATGQLWGNPVYDWEALRETGYRWWIHRLQARLEYLDAIRIDHFRGFEAAWHIPAGASNAASGTWVGGPGASFFEKVASALGGLPLLAEDLGIITRGVEALRDRFKLPGMRVLQFAFDGDPNNIHLPHQYTHNCVAYTGTHDNDTTLGWYNALSETERSRLWGYLRQSPSDANQVVWSLIHAAGASAAALVISPFQDLLGLGSAARMNIPGRADGQWSWRCPENTVDHPCWQRLWEITQKTGRSAEEPGRSGRRSNTPVQSSALPFQ